MVKIIEHSGADYNKRQQDMLRVVNAVREMDDRTMWQFLRTLAHKASQHYDMREAPFDVASHFVIEHYDNG